MRLAYFFPFSDWTEYHQIAWKHGQLPERSSLPPPKVMRKEVKLTETKPLGKEQLTYH